MVPTGKALAVLAFLSATLAPATAPAVASAELYRTQPHVYGRFEARIRFAAGDGVISSFFLWKDGSEAPGAYWNELDLEKLGADCHLQTNALYGSPLASTEQLHTMPSDLCDAYHDYAFEWTPAYVAWFIDGQEIRRDAGAIAAAFAENATAGMSIHFNIWPGNANFGGNFDPAILPVHQYISWVQYSSWVNDTFTLEWRDEFDGATLPSGWATGSWASPYNLSTHNPANVGFANGIAVLSLTADDATGFTGTPPPDAGGTGGASAGAGGVAAGGSGGAAGGTAASDAGGIGVSGAAGAAPTAGATQGAAESPSDSGCGCRMASARAKASVTSALVLALGALLRRRAGRSKGPREVTQC